MAGTWVLTCAAALAAAGSLTPSASLRSALLSRSDLGRGWTIEAPAPSRAPTLSCRAFSPHPAGIRIRASVASATFQESSQGPFLSQSAYLYGSAAQERTVRRLLVVSKLLRCAAARFAAGGKSYAVTSSHVSALRRPGGSVTRYRIAGTVTGEGQTLPAFLDELVVGQGAAITVLDVSALEGPPADSLERRLAGSAADKLRRAG